MYKRQEHNSGGNVAYRGWKFLGAADVDGGNILVKLKNASNAEVALTVAIGANATAEQIAQLVANEKMCIRDRRWRENGM